MSADRELWVVPLGTRAYTEVWERQRTLAHQRISGEIPQDMLLLVEHPPVVTLGRSARDPGHLLATPAALAARGVELFEVERGGDVTFHGPGQLVGYPIVDLNRHTLDLHWYLRQLEAVLIDAVAPFGIVGERSSGQTGVWTNGRKLASIGVHARQWVTWHGFALNVSTDLSFFDLMVPCGIPDVQMTSISAELARHAAAAEPIAPPGAVAGTTVAAETPALMPTVVGAVTRSFATRFALDIRHVDIATLPVPEHSPS